MSMTELLRWQDISKKFVGAALLTGNGASRAIWSKFEYSSLYELARSDEVDEPLGPQDEALFKALDTTNFEHVLRSLRVAVVVNKALGRRTDVHEERYEAIRAALLDAVNAVHVPWDAVGTDRLDYLAEVLAGYRAAYTTNYDLLHYWAMMREPKVLGDFFWGGCFNPKDTELFEGRVPVYFLHGALHLFRDDEGATCKLVREEWSNLLKVFREGAGVREPLFVSEGTSEDKTRAIRESDYLSFVHDALWEDKGPFVVFGHSLGDEDGHIRDALQRPSLEIAIGVRRQSDAETRGAMARYQAVLPRPRLFFFDARSHPLGDTGLLVSG